MAKELESKIQRRCQSIIKDAGAFVFKTHGDMYMRTGIPDLVCCIPVTKETLTKLLDENWFKDNRIGIFVGLEVKRENQLGDVSKAQQIVGNEIKRAGGLWFAVDDSELVRAITMKMTGGL